MAEQTAISWTDHTFNPWIGCTRVSPACDSCYAATSTPARVHGVRWEAGAPRHRTAESTWRQVLAWNRKAVKAGVRRRVFCASLADVFDREVPHEWRADLFALIMEAPGLDWLLLTKRPQMVRKLVREVWLYANQHAEPALEEWCRGWINGDAVPSNVWLGTTCENQEEADRRIPHLLGMPAALHFLSCEPLLGPVNLARVRRPAGSGLGAGHIDALRGWTIDAGSLHRGQDAPGRIGWVIAGGESGDDARPMHPDWSRSLRDQCSVAGVPFHFKQWGEWREFEHGLPNRMVAIGSEEAEAVLASAIRPGWVTPAGRFFTDPDDIPRGQDGRLVERLGKSRAGHLLDGVEHLAVPVLSSTPPTPAPSEGVLL
jgi:protein gp37